ncbi:helix-turn-helix domain-containing protein [Tenacibaculum ovolyticum]|uniref:helix-turn-helix domain-containing protein n=1 Tax=Tenacibaculum ovolyticum TaxID=104270 RepID=UPI0006878EC7|nr:AraC family transcriptional regulator [Tenacibaculum ovolyticum]WBX77066.1 helix-turn-helix domain-containing protein [Tenacibaculum ovolyticum]
MEIVIVNNKKTPLQKILQLQNKSIDCGIKTSVYTINSSHGKGSITSYYFDGLLININNGRFKEDMTFTSKQNLNALELSILIEGEKIIRVSSFKSDLVLEKNESYFIYDDNQTKQIIFHKEKPIKEVKIRMYDDFIKKHKMQTLLSKDKILCLEKTNKNFTRQLTTKMEEIVTEILINSQKGLLKRIFLEAKTLELLHLELDFQTKKKYNSDNILKKAYKVENIIQTNLHEQISIEQLARRVLLNQNILKNEFKKLFGDTIFNYTKKLRMNKAKKLLTHTQKPIYEIADMVGYKNPTHFTAAFKKTEKKTPKKYRKIQIGL